MSITTTAIVAEYGAYYQDAGQNKKRILSLLSQGRQITNLATPIKTDDTIFRLAKQPSGLWCSLFRRHSLKKVVLILFPTKSVFTG